MGENNSQKKDDSTEEKTASGLQGTDHKVDCAAKIVKTACTAHTWEQYVFQGFYL
jgi:hypothetical protein